MTKKLSKFLMLMLALVLALAAFSACGQSAPAEPAAAETETEQEAAPAETETETEPIVEVPVADAAEVATDEADLPGESSGNFGGVGEEATWDLATAYEEYIPPAADYAMEIDIMMWAGDGEYHEDIGSQDLTPADLLSVNNAAAYAVAKEFKKLYPNVKINIYAKTDSDGGIAVWAQEIENFRAEHGKYPDVYCSVDLVGDVKRGLVADISIFENDPVYRTFNKSVLDMMNFEGRQFGLPQYLIPWGVWVNKSLAETNNIDIPEPTWTLDDYTNFISHKADDGSWYGEMDASRTLFPTSHKGFNYNLVNREDGDPYVDLANESFYSLMEYIPKWSQYAYYPQNDLGNAPVALDGYGYNNFKEGVLLAYTGDPWHMRDIAHPNPEHWGAARMADWDIYPRPSSPELGTTVGIVLDPIAIHNYFADPGVSEEEAYQKMQMAYEFLKFWCADTRAWQARADQMYTDAAATVSSLNDSLPMVTGAEFSNQMEIWYSIAEHQRYADPAVMPGFHEILRLWEAGEVWDIAGKAFPTQYEFEGSTREILYEYSNSWDVNVVGATRTDANWLDQIKSLMPDWNAQWNERWAVQFGELHAALEREDFHYNK